MRKFLFIGIILGLICTVHADEKAEPPKTSQTIGAVNAGLPAVWHPNVVTQMAISTRLDSTEDREGDTSVALAISKTLTKDLLIRGIIARAVQKEVTVGTATLIVKW